MEAIFEQVWTRRAQSAMEQMPTKVKINDYIQSINSSLIFNE